MAITYFCGFVGRISGLGPSQARLNRLFSGITLIRLVEQKRIVAEIFGDEIESLKETLRLSWATTPLYCMCSGEMRIELYCEGKLKRRLGYVHQNKLHCPGWIGRPYLADGNALVRWMDKRNLPHMITDEARQRTLKFLWWSTAPGGLQPEMAPDEAVQILLRSGIASEVEVARQLFKWIGSHPDFNLQLKEHQRFAVQILALLSLDAVRAASCNFHRDTELLIGASTFWLSQGSPGNLPDSSWSAMYANDWMRGREIAQAWDAEDRPLILGLDWSEFADGCFSSLYLGRSGLVAAQNSKLISFCLDSGTTREIAQFSHHAPFGCCEHGLSYLVTDGLSGKVQYFWILQLNGFQVQDYLLANTPGARQPVYSKEWEAWCQGSEAIVFLKDSKQHFLRKSIEIDFLQLDEVFLYWVEGLEVWRCENPDAVRTWMQLPSRPMALRVIEGRVWWVDQSGGVYCKHEQLWKTRHKPLTAVADKRGCLVLTEEGDSWYLEAQDWVSELPRGSSIPELVLGGDGVYLSTGSAILRGAFRFPS